MKLYSYVVARDYGFAPNPFFGVCTLATCKPVIRRLAGVDDWVVGTGSARYSLVGHLVFYMQVSEALSYDEYWADARFESKKSNLLGSLKQAYGDNIYHRRKRSRTWHQENSHHSHADGRPNVHNVLHDTQASRVLVAREFGYWGGRGPLIPRRFRDKVCATRGHKSNFSEGFVSSFTNWLGSLSGTGYRFQPKEWER